MLGKVVGMFASGPGPKQESMNSLGLFWQLLLDQFLCTVISGPLGFEVVVTVAIPGSVLFEELLNKLNSQEQACECPDET